MTKKKLCKFLGCVSLGLVILFFITVLVDYINYNEYNTSSPFYVSFIVRGLQFIVPSLVCFLVSFFMKRKIK